MHTDIKASCLYMDVQFLGAAPRKGCYYDIVREAKISC